LAQVVSGRTIRFARVSQERAEELLIGERQALRGILANLVAKPRNDNQRGEILH
jgi:allophanate hydrolase